MGSIVAYKCTSCNYATEQLSVGWGKAGRAKFWGGLAVCAECKDLLVLDLAEQRADRRDRRCAKCNGPVKLIEGNDPGDPVFFIDDVIDSIDLEQRYAVLGEHAYAPRLLLKLWLYAATQGV